MANRIAVLLINLDRLIAPECGMKRVFEFAGADHVDVSDLSVKVDPALPGVWRFAIVANGCWAPRTHNVFVTPRGAAPATLRLGVPGRTVAGLRYQPDAIQLVLREANGIAMRGNCQDRAFISDSQAPRARQVGKPWTEFWTATACEVTRKFAVMFTPEGARMRIAVASSD
jgi:hypothetical protein